LALGSWLIAGLMGLAARLAITMVEDSRPNET